MSKIYIITEQEANSLIDFMCCLGKQMHLPTKTVSRVVDAISNLPCIKNDDRLDKCINLLNKLLK